jgi:hypothetical protein
MYRAELHGKLSRDLQQAEDILTSNVFSFYLYADRVHLQHLLRACAKVIVTVEEAQHAHFRFWPTFDDGTEPDVVIELGGYYVLIEAKLHSGFGEHSDDQNKHQLLRESRQGRREAIGEGREFIFLTVTDEPIPRSEIYGVLQEANRDAWRWTNWSLIADALASGPLVPQMGRDLLALMQRKGLRRFNGFGAGTNHLEPMARHWFFNANHSGLMSRFGGFRGVVHSKLVELPGPLFANLGSTRRSSRTRLLGAERR